MLQTVPQAAKPAQNFLPGMGEFIPVTVPGHKRTLSREDEQNLARKLNLQPNQSKALAEFVDEVMKQTVETLISEFGNATKIRKLSMTDFKIPRGGRCDVAIANGNRDHILRYLYNVAVETDSGALTEYSLGADCFMKAQGLTKADAKLCRSIHGWVVNGASRALLKMLHNCVGAGKSVKQISDEFKKTEVFRQLMKDVQRLAVNIEKAYPPAADFNNQRLSVGRVKVAVASISLLVSNDLPVPAVLINRIGRAVKWITP